jgi:cell division protease FtsH
MSEKVGNISFYDSTGQSEYSFNKPYSEKTAELIDTEVKVIINASYDRAKKILTKYKKQHLELAELLLDKEVIFAEDMERIFGPRKSSKPIAEIAKPKKKTKKDKPELIAEVKENKENNTMSADKETDTTSAEKDTDTMSTEKDKNTDTTEHASKEKKAGE